MSIANAVLAVFLLASLHTTYMSPLKSYNCVLQSLPSSVPHFDVLEVRVLEHAGSVSLSLCTSYCILSSNMRTLFLAGSSKVNCIFENSLTRSNRIFSAISSVLCSWSPVKDRSMNRVFEFSFEKAYLTFPKAIRSEHNISTLLIDIRPDNICFGFSLK